MNNKNVRGIIALVVVTALSFGVITGSKMLSKDNGETTGTTQAAAVLEELDTAGAENIEKAVKTEDGYMVTVKTKGYGGDILMNVFFDEAAANVTKVEIAEHSETQDIGAKIAEADFLSQFEGVAAPVYLPGMSVEMPGTAEKTETAAEDVVLNDGTYEKRSAGPDDNGFIDIVTMTVADGKITEVKWDAETEDGTLKSFLSENGQYTMTEDGPTWKEQAEALGAAVVAGQSVDAVAMNDQGRTDAVSGVSIYIGGFTALAEECMKEAAGAKTVVLNDGTYEARTEAPDDNGFIDVVTVTVADGKITAVTWDGEKEDGTLKSVLSENGQYVMTEDGLTWKEQAEALGAAVVAGQSVDAVGLNDQGRTDAVSGVSIYIGGFTALVEQCLTEAAGETAAVEEAAAQPGTQVDAVSGATISSTAAVRGINNAFAFIQTVK